MAEEAPKYDGGAERRGSVGAERQASVSAVAEGLASEDDAAVLGMAETRRALHEKDADIENSANGVQARAETKFHHD